MRTVKSSRANGSPRRRGVVAAEVEEGVRLGREARSPVRPEPRQVLRRAARLQQVRRLPRHRQQARPTHQEPVAQRRRERKSARQAGAHRC